MNEQYIRDRVEVDPLTGCWNWKSARPGGYGSARVDGKTIGAHRASYIVFHGPIRGSLQIDHLCCNKSCVNPEHLEQVTVAVNIQRGRLARMAPHTRALRTAKRCIDCGTAASQLLRCNACDSQRQQAANARSFLKKMLGVELRATVDARASAAGVSTMEYVAAIVRATVQP